MKLSRLIFLYIVSLIIIFIIILGVKNIKNIYLLALMLAIIPTLAYLAYLYFNREQQLFDKTSLRYTMHCKNCGWEWMSNISEKAPSTCPNCRSKDRSEIIGWRKVKLSDQKKQEKDLRSFFRL